MFLVVVVTGPAGYEAGSLLCPGLDFYSYVQSTGISLAWAFYLGH